MNDKLKFYDTNVLLHNLKLVKNNGDFLISSIVLQELENIKTSGRKDEQTKFEARQATRFLNENEDNYKVIVVRKKHHELLKELELDEDNDNLILACAKLEEENYDIKFITDDICCYNLGKYIFKLNVHKSDTKIEDEYKGFKEVSMTDEEMATMYNDLTDNRWDLVKNEYLLVKNESNEIVDKLKWNGETLEILKYTTVQHRLTDKIKPRNIKQELLFDMLQDKNSKLKVIQGLHGTGKTLAMIVHALSLIEKGKFDKIIWVVQNQQVSDTKDIGALPGGLEEKLMPYTSIFSDKVGGQYGVDMLISERKLEVIPLAYIRGRSFSNSIVMMSEAENTTSQHMKLLISRLEEDSILMIDGDFKQTDKEVFKSNNGLKAMIERLKGQPEFALMTLDEVERSKLANLASLLD